VDGLRLCEGHYRELERLVAEMPARYDDLDRALLAAGAGGGAAGGHPGLEIDEAAADLRSQIRHDLLWWCGYVADHRGVTRLRREDPFTAAAWLTIHIDWLAADQRAATELLPVLRELTGRSYGITDIPARHLDLGEQCLVNRDGERCTGIVTLVVRGDDWTATCPACRDRARRDGVRYEPQDAIPYLRLAQRGKWITADDVVHLAALFGVTANADVVYQWKSRKRIVGRAGPVENMYDLASVQRYLVRRQGDQRRVGA
jgi:hypothetical protein